MKKVIIALIAILIAVGFIFGWQYYQKNRIVSHQFVGQIKQIRGNIITLEGNYISKDHPETQSKDQQATVLVDVSNAEFIVEEIILPSQEQIEKNKGVIMPGDLRREEKKSSLAELNEASKKRSGLSLTADSDRDIYKKSSFSVSRIKYSIRVDNPI